MITTGNKSMHALVVATVLLGVVLGGTPRESSSADFARVNAERMRATGKEPGSWMTRGGSYYETYFSPLDKINTSNVSKLGLAWAGDFDTARGQQATPLFVDGVLYTSTSWSKVYAYDAATGKELWRYDPKLIGRTETPGRAPQQES